MRYECTVPSAYSKSENEKVECACGIRLTRLHLAESLSRWEQGISKLRKGGNRFKGPSPFFKTPSLNPGASILRQLNEGETKIVSYSLYAVCGRCISSVDEDVWTWRHGRFRKIKAAGDWWAAPFTRTKDAEKGTAMISCIRIDLGDEHLRITHEQCVFLDN